MAKNCWTLLKAALWICACCFALSAAATGRFLVKEWTTDEKTEKGYNIPQDVVISMTQTRDGYLWLGTGYGLARFDGVRFKTFEEDQAAGLSGSKIVKLFEDSHRNLWIATDNAGVLVVDSQGKINNVSLSQPAIQGRLVDICEDTDGHVWFSMSDGQVYQYTGGKPNLVLKDCRGLMADTSGLIWIGTSDGRLLGGPVRKGTGALDLQYEVPVGPKLDFLLASKSEGFWCLANGRISKWKKEHLEKDLGSYPWRYDVKVLAACEDLEGNLIVGTYGEGVYWFDTTGKATHVDGVSHSSIWCLLMDREGNLWVGTNGGGLNRVRPQIFEVLAGTEGATVQSVCADQSGGIWIGYHGERLDHWSTNGLQHFTNIRPPDVFSAFTNVSGVIRFDVQTVLEDQAHQLWVGGSSTMNPRLCLFARRNDRFYPVAGPAAIQGDPGAMFQDKQGLLWVGTQAGLVRWDGRTWQVFTRRDGLTSDQVRALAEDREGTLWVGTDGGGLNRLRDGKFTAFRKQPKEGLPGDDVSSIYIDADDVLWIGTANGLARYDHQRWKTFGTHEGLASNRIGYLLEDDQGYLWIGSNAGLMRVKKKDLNEFADRPGPTSVACRVFGKADGMPRGECSSGSQPGACRTANSNLWFPTIQGLVMVQPSLIQTNANPPPVVIEAVMVDGVLQSADTLRAPPLKSLTIPAGKESLEIHFASLNLSAPYDGLVKYRLEPHESTWTEADAQRRYARYPRLPHGQYRFVVKACNEDGLWSETPASLDIVVLPPFWQTWWFLTGSSILLLGCIVGSVHYVSTQKLQRQLAAMRQREVLERERARIARDLHDQLGANLTQVALLGELAESDKHLPKEVEAHARQICQTARETTHALDEIVWTVNPSNDTLDGLINYVCKYAQDYLAMAGLKYRLEVPPDLPRVPITPELRHNVFLASKEAINNVVKHSKATSVWLRLKLEPERFVLEIEDNGRGINAADEKKGRNGLRNMRKRLEEVGGEFEFGPGAEGGTRVRLLAPQRAQPVSPATTIDAAARDHDTETN